MLNTRFLRCRWRRDYGYLWYEVPEGADEHALAMEVLETWKVPTSVHEESTPDDTTVFASGEGDFVYMFPYIEGGDRFLTDDGLWYLKGKNGQFIFLPNKGYYPPIATNESTAEWTGVEVSAPPPYCPGDGLTLTPTVEGDLAGELHPPGDLYVPLSYWTPGEEGYWLLSNTSDLNNHGIHRWLNQNHDLPVVWLDEDQNLVHSWNIPIPGYHRPNLDLEDVSHHGLTQYGFSESGFQYFYTWDWTRPATDSDSGRCVWWWQHVDAPNIDNRDPNDDWQYQDIPSGSMTLHRHYLGFTPNPLLPDQVAHSCFRFWATGGIGRTLLPDLWAFVWIGQDGAIHFEISHEPCGDADDQDEENKQNVDQIVQVLIALTVIAAIAGVATFANATATEVAVAVQAARLRNLSATFQTGSKAAQAAGRAGAAAEAMRQAAKGADWDRFRQAAQDAQQEITNVQNIGR